MNRRSNCPLCGAVTEADLTVVQTGFEQEALLEDAARIIAIVKEIMGEHAEPEAESTEVWLRRCNEWLDGYKAVGETAS